MSEQTSVCWWWWWWGGGYGSWCLLVLIPPRGRQLLTSVYSPACCPPSPSTNRQQKNQQQNKQSCPLPPSCRRWRRFSTPPPPSSEPVCQMPSTITHIKEFDSQERVCCFVLFFLFFLSFSWNKSPMTTGLPGLLIHVFLGNLPSRPSLLLWSVADVERTEDRWCKHERPALLPLACVRPRYYSV